MIVLRPSTFNRLMRGYKYASITGGRGVKVTKQPGGGASVDPGSWGGDAGGLPASVPDPGPPMPDLWPDPYAPSVGSVSGFTVYGAGYAADDLL
jgi:hypothetical protein